MSLDVRLHVIFHQTLRLRLMFEPTGQYEYEIELFEEQCLLTSIGISVGQYESKQR